MAGRNGRWTAVAVVLGMLAGSVVAVASAVVAPPAQAAPPPLVFDHAQKVRDLGFPDNQGYAVSGTTADVDGDGDRDVPVAMVRNVSGVGARSNVVVLPNAGTGTFGTPLLDVSLPNSGPGPGPGSIYYGVTAHLVDLTGSSAPDLVMKSSVDDVLRIRPGNGGGTFGAEVTVTGVVGAGLRFADVDGDGRTDLASQGGFGGPDYGKVAILRNTAGGWVRQDLTDVGQTDLAFIDLAGNGRPSLLARASGPLLRLPNDGNGTFGSPVQLDGVDPRGFAVGDFDGLGGQDALVVDGFGNVSFFANDGAGGLVKKPSTVQLPGAGTAVRPQSTVDVDGDGRVDGLFPAGKTTAVVHADASGTLTSQLWAVAPATTDGEGYGQPTYSADLVDLTGDGRADLVSGLAGSLGRATVTVAAADAVVPGRFLAPSAFDTADASGSARTLALADMDEDARLDLVYHVSTSSGSRVRVARGLSGGTFAAPTEAGQSSPGCGPNARIATEDFDGDDHLDVVCVDGAAAAAFGDGAGHIGSSTGLPLNSTGVSGGVGRSMAIADFDVDGHPDVVFTVTNNCCPFGEPWIGSLVVQRYNPANPRTFVTDGAGIGLGRLSGPESVVAGDFDGDGKPDIVFRTGVQADGSGGERFSFFKGNGDGTFAAAVNTAPGLPHLDQMEAGDVDGDGDLDIVGVGSGQIAVVPGNGDGTFAAPQSSPSDAAFDVTLADLNNDGRRDIVTGTWTHGVQIRTVSGAGVLSDAAYLPAAGERQDGVVAGDVDGDGRVDIVSTVYTNPHVTVQRNRSAAGPSGPPDLRPLAVSAPGSVVPGATGDITYTVKNQGGPITGKRWVDRVYLSTDGAWDPSDRLFASVARSADLDGGATYSQTVTAPFLPLASGPHHVIVRTDLFNDVGEAQEANNLFVAGPTVDLGIPVLAPGGTANLTLADGQLAYLQVAPSGGPDQLLSLTSGTTGVAELVAGDGRVPTPTDGRDHEALDPAHPQLLLPAVGVTRYVLVRGRPAAGAGTAVAVSLRNLGFEITSVAPDHGSNQGSATVVLRGAGFAADATASLTRDGTTRTPTKLVRHDATHLEATFDLTGLSVGTADLVVTNPGGATASAIGAFEVTADAPGRIEASLTNPGLMRTNRIGTATITVRNTGGTDLPIPLVRLDTQGGARFRPAGTTTFVDDPLAFFPRRAGGPTLALPPGTEVRIDVPFVPSNQTINQVIAGGRTTIQFRLTTVSGATTAPFDWTAAFAPFRPAGLSDATWAAIVGWVNGGAPPASWADYVALVERLQAEAASIGRTLVSESAVLQFLVDKGLVFAPGASVSGRLVRDDGGTSFDRGRVRLVPLGAVTATASVPVWADGSFAARELPAGRYRIEVEGWLQATLPETEVVDAATTKTTVRVADGQVLQGFVTRIGDGSPVPGAEVAVTDPATGKVVTAIAGTDGRYEQHGLRAGTNQVTTTAKDLVTVGPEPVDVADGPATDHDVSMGGGGGVSGQVLPAPGGAVVGATVSVIPDAPPARPATLTVAADGAFAFGKLAAGGYLLVAERAGAGRVTAPVTVVDGATVSGVQLGLTLPAAVAGTVRDQSGALAPGITVRAALPGGGEQEAVTDDAGAYRLDDLPTGAVPIVAEATGYSSAVDRPVLAAGATTTVDLVVSRLGHLSGSVRTPGGDPVSGLEVRLLSAAGVPFGTTTGADGGYAFDDLTYGDYLLSLPDVGVGQGVTFDAATPGRVVDLVADLATVSATVERDGEPVPGAPVYLIPDAADGAPVTRRTGPDGRVAFHVAAAGGYRLVTLAAGMGTAAVGPFTVTPGTDVDLGTLAGGTSSVVVSVTAAGGSPPIAGAQVRLTPVAVDAEGAALSSATGAGGTVSFSGVAPGSYVVDVLAEGRAGQRTTLTVDDPTESVAVALDPGLSLRRRVVAAGQPVAGAVVSLRERTSGLRFASLTDAAGEVAFAGLPAGTYDGWASAPGLTSAALTGLVPAAPPATSSDVALVPSTTRVIGRLVVAGVPTAGGRVEAVDDDGTPVTVARSDADGQWVLAGLPAVPLNIRVTAGGGTVLLYPASQVFPTGDTTAPGGGGGLAVGGARESLGGPPPIPPFRSPDERPPTLDLPSPADLARSWVDRYLRKPERDRRDDPEAMQARLGPFNPNDCPEVQAAWIRAFDLIDRKDRAFFDLKENHDKLFWQTLGDLQAPAAIALKLLGKLAVAAELGPELAAVQSLSIGLSAAQLAEQARLFESLFSLIADLGEYVGNLRGQLISGDFDAVGNTLQVLGTAASAISVNGAAFLDRLAPGLGEAGARSANLIGLAISVAADLRSITLELQAAVVGVKVRLEAVAASRHLYEGFVDRSLAALDALDEARRKGCPDDPPTPPDPPPPPDGPGPKPPDTDVTVTETTFTNSRDPNAITGPAGQGTERFITATQPLAYTVDFENVKTAGAPAQEVQVHLPLDGDVDAATATLGVIGFGSTRIDVPAGRRTFDTSVPLAGTSYTVEVRARIDVDDREATWTFRTIDPTTGDLPEDPLAGFLPPNVTSPQGEGFVELAADPVASLPVGTTITEQASIVFDDNPALATNTWTNTIGVPQPAVAGGFHPVAPARILDTRTGVGGPATKLGPGETRTLQVTGVGGVPAAGVSAVAINVTAVQPSAPSHLTVWPTGSALPGSSNLNVVAGQTVPNLVVSAVGPDGTISIRNNSGTVHVLGDVTGWYDFSEGSRLGMGTASFVPDAEPGAALVPLTPARVLDTRPGSTVGGPATKLGPAETRDVQVAGQGGVPASGAVAVVLNVTAVSPSAATHLTVWPAGLARPETSVVNATPGIVIPNLVMVPLGAEGKVSLFNNAGTVDVLFDVVGYYALSTPLGTLHGLVPSRILDTRPGTATGGPASRLGAGEQRSVAVTGVGGVPAAGVGAVVLNVTAVNPSSASFLTVWPDGEARPLASNLNLAPGRTLPNLVVAKVGADGKVALYNNSGDVDVLFDVVGYLTG